jgi:Glyoxalase-like domain
MATAVQVVIDCADPARLAEFWATALGYQVQDPPPGFATWQEFLAAQHVPESEWNSASAVVDPDGSGPRVFFQRVPEPKAVKNRVHLDLNVGGGRSVDLETRRTRVNAEGRRLERAGATQVRATERHGEYWIVMLDPEGNEFCLQ